jgi:hypothetical protein
MLVGCAVLAATAADLHASILHSMVIALGLEQTGDEFAFLLIEPM